MKILFLYILICQPFFSNGVPISVERSSSQLEYVLENRWEWKQMVYVWEESDLEGNLKITGLLKVLPNFTSSEIPTDAQLKTLTIIPLVAGVGGKLILDFPPSIESWAVRSRRYLLGLDGATPIREISSTESWRECDVDELNINLDFDVSCANPQELSPIVFNLESPDVITRNTILDANFGFFLQADSRQNDADAVWFQVNAVRMTLVFETSQEISTDSSTDSSATTLDSSTDSSTTSLDSSTDSLITTEDSTGSDTTTSDLTSSTSSDNITPSPSPAATTDSSGNDSRNDSSNDSSNALAIALGITIPVLFLLGLTCVLIWFFLRRGRNKQRANMELEDHYQTHLRNANDLSNSPIPSPGNSNQSWGRRSSGATNASHKGTVKNADWEIDYNELVFSKELGRGAYGVVYLGSWRYQQVAIKKLNAQEITDEIVEDFMAESNLYKNLRPHQHVVRLFGVCSSELCIITEFLEKGDMASYVRKNNVKEALVLRFAKEIAAGMAHLHAEGIVHRDLAARNVLLSDKLEVKIADFGMARVLVQEENPQHTQATVGPLKWMAPECILNREYSSKSDVWAYGITLIEIITQNIPYPGQDPLNVCVGVSSQGMKHPIPEKTPSRLVGIITNCFETNPEKRPTFDSIFKQLC